MKNKNVEEFFLEALPRIEGIPLSQGAGYLSRYYQEIEDPKLFPSENYASQRDRVRDMFPSLPEKALDLVDMKFTEHRQTDHGETGNEEYIETLAITLEGTEYEEYSTRKWWAG